MQLLVPNITSTTVSNADLALFKQNVIQVKEALNSHYVDYKNYNEILDSLEFATKIETKAKDYIEKLVSGDVAFIKAELEVIQGLGAKVRILQEKAKKNFKENKKKVYEADYRAAIEGYYPDYLKNFIIKQTDFKVMFKNGNEPMVNSMVNFYLENFKGKTEQSYEAIHIKNCEHLENSRSLFSEFLEICEEFKQIINTIPSIGFKNNCEAFKASILTDWAGMLTLPLNESSEKVKKSIKNQVEFFKIAMRDREKEIEQFKQYELDYTVDYFNISEPLHLQSILDAELERLKRMEQIPVTLAEPLVKEVVLPKSSTFLYVKFKLKDGQSREDAFENLKDLEIINYNFKQE